MSTAAMSALDLGARRLKADLAQSIAEDFHQADAAQRRRVRRIQASTDYYVEQNGCTIWSIAAAFIAVSVVLLWGCVCLEAEIRARERALNVLELNGNNAQALRNENVRRAVEDAERLRERNVIFAALCRMVTDSAPIVAAGAYEGAFRAALLSALQQHWFMAMLVLGLPVCFALLLFALVHFSCTRQMWTDAPPPAAKKGQQLHED